MNDLKPLTSARTRKLDYKDDLGIEHRARCTEATYAGIIKEFKTLEMYFKSLGIHTMKGSEKVIKNANK